MRYLKEKEVEKSSDYNYDNYWEDSEKERKKYYENLYSGVKGFYKFSEGKKILDVAGGSGQLSNYFRLKNITLIDTSDSGLKIARTKFNFKTKKCDLVNDSWPTRNENFDYAICNEFLEHVYCPSKILGEIAKSLKDGGILYVGQPNMAPDGEHHVRRINYSYLKSILKENGFIIKEEIIVPKIINSRFSEVSSTKPIITNAKLFVGAAIGIFISNKLKYALAKKFPDILAGFYHIRAEKIS